MTSGSVDAQSPRQEAQEAAGAVTGATNTVKGGQAQLPDVVPGFQTANPDHLTNHYDEGGAGLEDATIQGLANDDDGEGGEAASTILDTYTTRPRIDVTRTDEFLSNARGALGNPDLLAGDLFSTNQNPACRPTEVTPSPLEIKSCDVFRAPGDSNCAVGTEVDVLAEKTYACLKETATYRKQCEEELSVSCKQILSNCRLEDGLITTADPDIQVSYTNFRHRVHLPNKEVAADCRAFVRSITVNVTDITKLSVARLSRVDFQDALTVYVNGIFVWGGPYGDGSVQNLFGNWNTATAGKEGNDPLIRPGIGDPVGYDLDGLDWKVQYLGSCNQSSNTVTTPGIDIKPFMREGENIIEFHSAITGDGGFTADFQILMQCCGEWEETWSQQCPY